MSSKDNNNTIICDKLGAGFTFNNVSMVILTNITFIGCGSDFRFYAVLQLSQVNINISACTFLHSKGRAIEAAHANVTIQNCTFENSTAGVVIAENNTAMYDIGSIYTHNALNFSMDLSALLFLSSSTANYTNSTFHENFAKPNMIRVTSGKLAMIACELARNNGIRLLMSTNSIIKIFNSTLTHNFALRSYSLIQISTTNISIDYSTLTHNVAKLRATILHVRDSIVESCHTLTIVNNISHMNYSYTIMDIRDSEVRFGIVDYSNNTGTILFVHSKAKFTKQSKFQNHKQVKGPYSYGGAITSIASIIRFQGITNFCNNYAKIKGRAIYATESRIYTNGDTLFSNNKARWSGGALYLDQSDFICQKKCTFIGNMALKGGAIHAISSIFTMGSDWNKFGQNKDIKSSLFFASNLADKGGAVYLEANSKFRAPRGENCTYELEFDNNVATLGGAIFVNNYTDVCNRSVCFIQIPNYASNLWNSRIRINSTAGNTTIYGGLLDRCTVERRYSGNDLKSMTTGFNYIKRLTKNVNINDMMTSSPVRVCYCIDSVKL